MKDADVKRGGARTRALMVATASLMLAVATTGCGSECVDAYDCRNEKGPAPAGQQWTCAAEKCETRPIQPVPGDDAGTDPEPDAGTDPDAGTNPEPDAGTDPEPDAGTDPDAGSGDACETAVHDPVLGTLRLEAGFEAAGSAPLPDDVLALAASPGPTYTVYAVRGSGMGVDVGMYSLGNWPDLQPNGTMLFDVVSPADRSGTATVFSNHYLVNDGRRLFAGYTTSAAGAHGSVAAYDIATPAASSYIAAQANFTAASFEAGGSTVLLVNGVSLGDATAGLGVFGLVTSEDPFRAVRLANFPAGEAGANGYTVVADNGIAMLGYSSSVDYSNKARVVAPSVLATALSSGTPVELGAQTELDVGSDFNASSAFGAGVVVKRGAYDDNWQFVSTDVSRFPVSLGIDPAAVAIGERAPVLTLVDQCTSVTQLAQLGQDLLVGVDDKNGHRLVRIQVGR